MSEYPNQRLMESIWTNIPKEKLLPENFRGEYIRYIATDPKFLYMTGFVDDSEFTCEEWEAAFEDCKQADNTYLISKEKFLSLGKFKFVGIVRPPLDIMKVREGWYDLNKWHEFCVKALLPNTTISVESLIQAEKMMKEQGKVVKGRIFVDKSMKLKMKSTIDTFASPRRLRELSIQDIHEKRVQKEKAKTLDGFQKSDYQKGGRVGSEQQKNLKESLLKTSSIKATANDNIETIDLKQIMKERKSGPKKNV